MKKYIYIFLVVIFVIGWLYVYQSHRNRPVPNQQTNPGEIRKYTDITSEQLYSMLKNKDFYLVNVHIPYEGEIEKTDAFIPYNEIDNDLDKLPQNKNSKIVLYCRSGRMSEIAAKRLAEIGYTDVYNLLLGMHDWQSKGYPLR